MTASNPPLQQSYAVTKRAFGVPLLVLTALQLMVVLDGTVVIFALARLKDEMGLSHTGAQWIVTSYVLAFGGLLLLGGRLGDAFPRRTVFLSGVALFTAASAACGLAVNPEMLLTARVVQGIGAAVASPSAMAMIVLTFAPGRVRTQAFSVYTMMTGVGSVAGLIVGGALTQVSWRWIFLINVPIGIIILIGGRALPSPRGRQISLDIFGAILATVGCTALVFGLSMGGENGWDAPITITGLVGGVVLIAAFIFSQRRVEHPVLPLTIFRDRSRSATFLALTLVGAVLLTMTVNVAVFVQEDMGYSPLKAGVSFIPFTLALALGAELSGKACSRWQPRWIVACGGILLAAGLLLGSELDDSAQYWPDLLVAMLVIGAGVGMTMIPLMLSAVAGAQPDNVGPITAVANVANQLGGPIGLAGAGAIVISLNWPDTGALAISAIFALACVAVALTSIRFTPNDISEGQQAEAAMNEADIVDQGAAAGAI